MEGVLLGLSIVEEGRPLSVGVYCEGDSLGLEEVEVVVVAGDVVRRVVVVVVVVGGWVEGSAL